MNQTDASKRIEDVFIKPSEDSTHFRWFQANPVIGVQKPRIDRFFGILPIARWRDEFVPAEPLAGVPR